MKPYAELLYYNQLNPVSGRIKEQFRLREPEDIVEFSGRWDYGPENAAKLGQPSKSGKKMIQNYLDMGHESMIEMGDATFFIECSRVVSHELVRHRIASFQQESQRFVKYDNEDPEDLFYIPEGIPDQWREEMLRQNTSALDNYKDARNKALAPQIARYVLPNATRTRIIMKANIREWRHIIKLRLHTSAQPEMREVMQQIYDQLVEVYPQCMSGVIDSGRAVR